MLEIQGAGLVQLPNGQQVALGYAGENGAPYRSIAKALIDRGVFTKDTASMQHIRQYVKTHPAVGRLLSIITLLLCFSRSYLTLIRPARLDIL